MKSNDTEAPNYLSPRTMYNFSDCRTLLGTCSELPIELPTIAVCKRGSGLEIRVLDSSMTLMLVSWRLYS